MRIAVLVSGRGSNMLRLADYFMKDQAAARRPDCEIGLVAANKACAGLDLADQRGLATSLVDRSDFETRAAQETVLAKQIEDAGVDWICLAGYMAVLSASFVARFAGRIINIHPSLLPAHKGLDTHKRVLEAGDTMHGATVHLVTPALDDGPIILQAGLAVESSDNPDSLAARVLTLEHVLYPFVIESLANGAVRIENGRVGWPDQPAALANTTLPVEDVLGPHLIWP